MGLSEQEIHDFFENASCDAFGCKTDDDMTGLPLDYRRGPRGKLTVPPANSSGSFWYNLDNYTAAGAARLDNVLFFSSLNVPTRAFDAGFPLLTG